MAGSHDLVGVEFYKPFDKLTLVVAFAIVYFCFLTSWTVLQKKQRLDSDDTAENMAVETI